jgi:hypothetical protein
VTTLVDERGIIINWLVKIVLLLAVLGVIAFDVGSILIGAVTVDSAADEVAVAVSVAVGNGPPRNFTDQEIFLMARGVIADPANDITAARVLHKGTGIDEEGVVHIRLRRTADTLVTKRISQLRHFTVVTGDGQAGTN